MKDRVTDGFRAGLLMLAFMVGVADSSARAQQFDLVSYSAPAGWKMTQEDSHVTFTTIDQAAGTYVMVALYNSAARSGDWDRDFSSEWNEIVAKSFSTSGAPRPTAARTSTGLEYREGVAQVGEGRSRAYVRFAVFAANRRMFSVLTVASHAAALRAKQSAVQTFFDNLRLAASGSGSSGPAPVSGGGSVGAGPAGTGSTRAGSGVPASGAGIAGVWMTFKASYPDWEPRPRWYVFYEDGQVFEDIPRAGLAGFNRQASKADPPQRNYWGTYSINGGSGSISKPGVKYPEAIAVEGSSKMKVDSEYFNRCRAVDGLRLQGIWTSYSNPNDPALDGLAAGQRPIFRFTADGRFVDEGVLASFLRSTDRSTDGAGSGTYELRDFTLVLRYADGRTKQLAFSAMLGADPATSNDIVFIGRSRFNKKK